MLAKIRLVDCLVEAKWHRVQRLTNLARRPAEEMNIPHSQLLNRKSGWCDTRLRRLLSIIRNANEFI